MKVRDAQAADAAAIARLYNHFIPTRTIAWTETEDTVGERIAWLKRQRAQGFPVLVAELDGSVVGFAAYGYFRDSKKWPGYSGTVEHTIHIEEGHWGRGIGRALMNGLFDHARAAGIHVMVGAIDGENPESIAFHERLGFVEVARMPEVGRKFGRWLDLILMQLLLDE